jgi:C2 domain
MCLCLSLFHLFAVIKCENLENVGENTQVNAYVKCALVALHKQQNDYQRTAVHRNSPCPIFDQKFEFVINDYSDYAKYVQIAVWHRNRDLK